MKFSRSYIEKAKNLVKPEDQFESLAKDGLLNEYIEEFFHEKYRNDKKFRERIMLLQLEYSDEPVDEISKEYLVELSEALNEFINKVEK